MGRRRKEGRTHSRKVAHGGSPKAPPVRPSKAGGFTAPAVLRTKQARTAIRDPLTWYTTSPLSPLTVLRVSLNRRLSTSPSDENRHFK